MSKDDTTSGHVPLERRSKIGMSYLYDNFQRTVSLYLDGLPVPSAYALSFEKPPHPPGPAEGHNLVVSVPLQSPAHECEFGGDGTLFGQISTKGPKDTKPSERIGNHYSPCVDAFSFRPHVSAGYESLRVPTTEVSEEGYLPLALFLPTVFGAEGLPRPLPCEGGRCLLYDKPYDDGSGFTPTGARTPGSSSLITRPPQNKPRRSPLAPPLRIAADPGKEFFLRKIAGGTDMNELSVQSNTMEVLDDSMVQALGIALNEGEQLKSHPCIIEEYNEDSRLFQVRLTSNGQLRFLNRASVLFPGELPSQHAARVTKAKLDRIEYERKLRLDLYVQMIHPDKTEQMSDPMMRRILMAATRGLRPEHHQLVADHVATARKEHASIQQKVRLQYFFMGRMNRMLLRPLGLFYEEEATGGQRADRQVAEQARLLKELPPIAAAPSYSTRIAVATRREFLAMTFMWSGSGTRDALQQMREVWMDRYRRLALVDLRNYQTKAPVLVDEFIHDIRAGLEAANHMLQLRYSTDLDTILSNALGDKFSYSFLNQQSFLESEFYRFFRVVRTEMSRRLREVTITSLKLFEDFFHLPACCTTPFPSEVFQVEGYLPRGTCRLKFELSLDAHNRVDFDPSIDSTMSTLKGFVSEIVECSGTVISLENIVMASLSLPRRFVSVEVSEQVKTAKAAVLKAVQLAEPVMRDILVRLNKYAGPEAVSDVTVTFSSPQLGEDLSMLAAKVEGLQWAVPNIVELGAFQVDCTRIKNVLIAQWTNRARTTLETVLKRVETTSGMTCEVLGKMSDRLRQRPTSAEEMQDLLSYSKDAVGELEALETVACNDVLHWVSVMEANFFAIPPAIAEQVMEMFLFPQKLKTQFADSEAAIIEERKAMIHELDQQREEIFEQIDGAADKLEELYYIYEPEKADDADDICKALGQLFVGIDRRIEELHRREFIFELPLHDFGRLPSLRRHYEVFEQFWFSFSASTQGIQRLMDQPIAQLAADKMVDEVETWRRTLRASYRCLRGFPEIVKLGHKTEVLIANFQETAVILELLKAPGIRAPHWKDLSRRIGLSAKSEMLPTDLTLTVQKVMAYNLHTHIEIVQEIASTAGEEFAVENKLEQMRAECRQMKLQFVEVNEEETMQFLKNPTETISVLDGYVNSTQTLRASPYIASHLSHALEWEGLLCRLQDTLGLWMTVQDLWEQLHPIISQTQTTPELEQVGKNPKSPTTGGKSGNSSIKKEERMPSRSSNSRVSNSRGGSSKPEERMAGSNSRAGQSGMAGSNSRGGQSGMAGSKSRGGQSGMAGSTSRGGQSGMAGSTSRGGQSPLPGGMDDEDDEDRSLLSQFQEADLDFRSIVDEVERHGQSLLSIMTLESLPLRLTEISSTLQSVRTGVLSLMDTKRNVFPRFYFVSNQDLLTCLSASNLSSISKLLPKMYYRLEALQVSNGEVQAFVSSDGVKLRNDMSITVSNEPIEVWMGKMDQALSISMKNGLEACFREHLKTPLKHWLFKWNPQFVDLVSRIRFGDELTEVVAATGSRGLVAYEKKLQRLIKEYCVMSHARKTMKKNEVQTLSDMIISEIHRKDTVQSLLHEGVSTISDLKTFPMFTTTLESNGECNVSFLGQSQKYGFEFLGQYVASAITQTQMRSSKALFLDLFHGVSSALMGPEGSGRSHFVRDSALQLGRMVWFLQCLPDRHIEQMKSIILGCAAVGAWIYLNDIHEVSRRDGYEISHVALQARKAMEEGTVKNITLQDGTAIPFKSTFAVLGGSGVPLAELPVTLQRAFRPLYVRTPDFRECARVFLFAFGFESAGPTVTDNLSSLFSQGSQLHPRLWYVGRMKEVVQLASTSAEVGARTNRGVNLLGASARPEDEPEIVALVNRLLAGALKTMFDESVLVELQKELLPQTHPLLEQVEGASPIVPSFSPEASSSVSAPVVGGHVLPVDGTHVMVVGPPLSGRSCLLRKWVGDSHVMHVSPRAIAANHMYGTAQAPGLLDAVAKDCAQNSHHRCVIVVDELTDTPLDLTWLGYRDPYRRVAGGSNLTVVGPSAVIGVRATTLSQQTPRLATMFRVVCLHTAITPSNVLERSLTFSCIAPHAKLVEQAANLIIPSLTHYLSLGLYEASGRTAVATSLLLKVLEHHFGSSANTSTSVPKPSDSEKRAANDTAPMSGDVSREVSGQQSSVPAPAAAEQTSVDDEKAELLVLQCVVFAFTWGFAGHLTPSKDEQERFEQHWNTQLADPLSGLMSLTEFGAMVLPPSHLFSHVPSQGGSWKKLQNEASFGTAVWPQPVKDAGCMIRYMGVIGVSVVVDGPPFSGLSSFMQSLATDNQNLTSHYAALSQYSGIISLDKEFCKKLSRRRAAMYGPFVGKRFVLCVDDLHLAANAEPEIQTQQGSISSLLRFMARYGKWQSESLGPIALADTTLVAAVGKNWADPAQWRDFVHIRFPLEEPPKWAFEVVTKAGATIHRDVLAASVTFVRHVHQAALGGKFVSSSELGGKSAMPTFVHHLMKHALQVMQSVYTVQNKGQIPGLLVREVSRIYCGAVAPKDAPTVKADIESLGSKEFGPEALKVAIPQEGEFLSVAAGGLVVERLSKEDFGKWIEQSIADYGENPPLNFLDHKLKLANAGEAAKSPRGGAASPLTRKPRANTPPRALNSAASKTRVNFEASTSGRDTEPATLNEAASPLGGPTAVVREAKHVVNPISSTQWFQQCVHLVLSLLQQPGTHIALITPVSFGLKRLVDFSLWLSGYSFLNRDVNHVMTDFDSWKNDLRFIIRSIVKEEDDQLGLMLSRGLSMRAEVVGMLDSLFRVGHVPGLFFDDEFHALLDFMKGEDRAESLAELQRVVGAKMRICCHFHTIEEFDRVAQGSPLVKGMTVLHVPVPGPSDLLSEMATGILTPCLIHSIMSQPTSLENTMKLRLDSGPISPRVTATATQDASLMMPPKSMIKTAEVSQIGQAPSDRPEGGAKEKAVLAQVMDLWQRGDGTAPPTNAPAQTEADPKQEVGAEGGADILAIQALLQIQTTGLGGGTPSIQVELPSHLHAQEQVQESDVSKLKKAAILVARKKDLTLFADMCVLLHQRLTAALAGTADEVLQQQFPALVHMVGKLYERRMPQIETVLSQNAALNETVVALMGEKERQLQHKGQLAPRIEALGKEIVEEELNLEKVMEELDAQKVEFQAMEAKTVQQVSVLESSKHTVAQLRDSAISLVEDARRELRDMDPKQCVNLRLTISPPHKIKHLLECICLLLGVKPDKSAGVKPDYWVLARRLMEDPDFVERLVTLNIDNPTFPSRERIKPFMEVISTTRFASASTFAQAMADLALAMNTWVLQEENAQRMEEDIQKSKNEMLDTVEALENKRDDINRLMHRVTQVRDHVERQRGQREMMLQELADCERRFDNTTTVSGLIGKLSDQWNEEFHRTAEIRANIVGDIFISCVRVVYCYGMLSMEVARSETIEKLMTGVLLKFDVKFSNLSKPTPSQAASAHIHNKKPKRRDSSVGGPLDGQQSTVLSASPKRMSITSKEGFAPSVASRSRENYVLGGGTNPRADAVEVSLTEEEKATTISLYESEIITADHRVLLHDVEGVELPQRLRGSLAAIANRCMPRWPLFVSQSPLFLEALEHQLASLSHQVVTASYGSLGLKQEILSAMSLGHAIIVTDFFGEFPPYWKTLFAIQHRLQDLLREHAKISHGGGGAIDGGASGLQSSGWGLHSGFHGHGSDAPTLLIFIDGVPVDVKATFYFCVSAPLPLEAPYSTIGRQYFTQVLANDEELLEEHLYHVLIHNRSMGSSTFAGEFTQEMRGLQTHEEDYVRSNFMAQSLVVQHRAELIGSDALIQELTTEIRCVQEAVLGMKDSTKKAAVNDGHRRGKWDWTVKCIQTVYQQLQYACSLAGKSMCNKVALDLVGKSVALNRFCNGLITGQKLNDLEEKEQQRLVGLSYCHHIIEVFSPGLNPAGQRLLATLMAVALSRFFPDEPLKDEDLGREPPYSQHAVNAFDTMVKMQLCKRDTADILAALSQCNDATIGEFFGLLHRAHEAEEKERQTNRASRRKSMFAAGNTSAGGVPTAVKDSVAAQPPLVRLMVAWTFGLPQVVKECEDVIVDLGRYVLPRRYDNLPIDSFNDLRLDAKNTIHYCEGNQLPTLCYASSAVEALHWVERTAVAQERKMVLCPPLPEHPRGTVSDAGPTMAKVDFGAQTYRSMQETVSEWQKEFKYHCDHCLLENNRQVIWLTVVVKKEDIEHVILSLRDFNSKRNVQIWLIPYNDEVTRLLSSRAIGIYTQFHSVKEEALEYLQHGPAQLKAWRDLGSATVRRMLCALVLLFCAIRQRGRIGPPEFTCEGTHLDVIDLAQWLRFLWSRREEGESKFVCLTVRSMAVLLLGVRSASTTDADLTRHLVPLFVSQDMVKKQNLFHFANSLQSSADLSEMLQRINDADGLLSMCGDSSSESQIRVRADQLITSMIHPLPTRTLPSRSGSSKRASIVVAADKKDASPQEPARPRLDPIHFLSWYQTQRTKILHSFDEEHVASAQDPVEVDVYVLCLMSPDLVLPSDLLLPEGATSLNRTRLVTQGKHVDDVDIPITQEPGRGAAPTFVLRVGSRHVEHVDGKFAVLNSVETSALSTARVTSAVEEWYQDTRPPVSLEAFISPNPSSLVRVARQERRAKDLASGTFMVLRTKSKSNILVPHTPSGRTSEHRGSMSMSSSGRHSFSGRQPAASTFELTSMTAHNDVKAILLEVGCLCTVTVEEEEEDIE